MGRKRIYVSYEDHKTMISLRASKYSNDEISLITGIPYYRVLSDIGCQPRGNYCHLGQYMDVNPHMTRQQKKDLRRGKPILDTVVYKKVSKAVKEGYSQYSAVTTKRIVSSFLNLSVKKVEEMERAEAYKSA